MASLDPQLQSIVPQIPTLEKPEAFLQSARGSLGNPYTP